MSNERKSYQRLVFVARITIAVIAILLTSIYTYYVVTGNINEKNRVDNSHIVLIVVTLIAVVLLLRPDILGRVKIFKAAGIEIETLQEVQVKQKRQEIRIEELSDIILLLIPEPERKHLKNLASGNTNYKSATFLRDQLRHLRSIGLINTLPGKRIGDTKGLSEFNIANYIFLTDKGKEWAEKLRSLDPDIDDAD